MADLLPNNRLKAQQQRPAACMKALLCLVAVSLLCILYFVVYVQQVGNTRFYYVKEQMETAGGVVYTATTVSIVQSSVLRSGRRRVFNLEEFGGVGDGVTLNTKAFQQAVRKIEEVGGGQLNVGPGRWLTAPFNLTSHMTLFLMKDAVILGVEDEKQWPLMPPLPSYGQGREKKGPRYGSLIHGQNLVDVVITGDNGTIDGQGQAWWTKFHNEELNNTRGPLVQLMWSKDIEISSVTLRNSPFWTVHLYDCKDVLVSNATVLAPLYGAPNTDGIDPDSCENVLIEKSYISVGDDAIAIKSGWDQYGIAYNKSSKNITIRNNALQSAVSAGISIGSEMSGGISEVSVENVHIFDSKRGIRIKTAPGRGGYVRHISYRNVSIDNAFIGIMIKTQYNEHPDEDFDSKALPTIDGVTFENIRGRNVRIPVRIEGSEDIPVTGLNFTDMQVGLSKKKKRVFQCSHVKGIATRPIFPEPCGQLVLYDEFGRLERPAGSEKEEEEEEEKKKKKKRKKGRKKEKNEVHIEYSLD